METPIPPAFVADLQTLINRHIETARLEAYAVGFNAGREAGKADALQEARLATPTGPLEAALAPPATEPVRPFAVHDWHFPGDGEPRPGPTPVGEANQRPDLHVPREGAHYGLKDVRRGRPWRHYRGSLYRTEEIGRWSTNGPDEGRAVVAYRNDEGGLCLRFAAEFLDGRFVPELEGAAGRGERFAKTGDVSVLVEGLERSLQRGSWLARLLGELAGGASLAWRPRPTGEFDSTLASVTVDRCLKAITERDRCLVNVREDEPIFVLRAQDRLAPGIIRTWGDRLAEAGGESSKIAAACVRADELEAWGQAHSAKVPD